MQSLSPLQSQPGVKVPVPAPGVPQVPASGRPPSTKPDDPLLLPPLLDAPPVELLLLAPPVELAPLELPEELAPLEEPPPLELPPLEEPPLELPPLEEALLLALPLEEPPLEAAPLELVPDDDDSDVPPLLLAAPDPLLVEDEVPEPLPDPAPLEEPW